MARAVYSRRDGQEGCWVKGGRVELEEAEAEVDVFAEVDDLLLLFCCGDLMD